MKLTHMTQKEITLNTAGWWGDFLFFTDCDSNYGKIKYELEIDEDEILACENISFSDLVDEEVEQLAQIINLQTGVSLDLELVQNLLAENISLYNVSEVSQFYIDDAALYADYSVEQQSLTAKAAKKMGYSAVAINDEFGKSYMIDVNVYFNQLVRA